MQFSKWFLSLMAVALLFVGCGDEPATEPTPEPTPPVEQGLTFDVDIKQVTKTSMTFDVVPSDVDSDYLIVVYDAPFVDDFTRDEYLVATIFDDAAAYAASSGLTFEEYMAANIDRGVVTDATFSGLAVDTDYYVLLFGVDAASGYELCSDVTKVAFRTQEAPQLDTTFDVTASVYLNSVTFDVVPSDKQVGWHLMTVEKAMYDNYTDPEGDMRWSKEYFYQMYFQNEIDQLLGAGYSAEQVVEALILTGDKQLAAKGLNANTDHIYLVAGMVMDADGLFIATPIHDGSYTTGDAAQSDMTFNIEVWDIEQMAVSVRITPSNNDDIYCALIQPWDGHSTALEVMNALVEQWGAWMQLMANDKGPVEHAGANKFKLDAPDTDYYVIAFGYEGGVTTAPEMVTFRSLPSDIGPERAEFTLTVGGITPYGFTIAVTTNDPTVYYAAGAILPEQWNEEEIVEGFNANFDYIFEQTKLFDAMITIPQILSTYYWNGNQTLQASGLRPDTEVMGYLLTIDNKTGHVAKVYTYPALARTASLGGITPSIELVGYYSGDEEAGSIFGEPDATAGKSIAVTKYVDFEGATALYSTILYGDYSSETAYADELLWTDCSGYWSPIKLTQPYSFFVADWETVQTVVAYATDADHAAGKLSRLYMLPTAAEKSPMEELRSLVDELNGNTRCTVAQSLVYDNGAVGVTPATVTQPAMRREQSLAAILPALDEGVMLRVDRVYRLQQRTR